MSKVKPANHINIGKLSLPQGASSVGAQDIKYTPNLFTGAADFAIPLPLPSSRSLQPHFSLSYNSNNGNGLLGMGFGLTESSISIKTNRALPKYDDTDIYQWEAQELVFKENSSKGSKIYLERHQSTFSLIEKKHTKKRVWWKVTSNDNTVSKYGYSDSSRISDPKAPKRIFKWLLSEQKDAKGNKVKYHYSRLNPEDNNLYLNCIDYGNYYDAQGKERFAFRIIVDYGKINFRIENDNFIFFRSELEVRKDPVFNFRSGFQIKTEYLVRNIFIQHHFVNETSGKEPYFTKCIHFNYSDPEESATVSTLKELTEYSLALKSEKYYTFEVLPSIKFEFCSFSTIVKPKSELNFKTIKDDNNKAFNQPLTLVDLKQEGIPGILYRNAETLYYNEPLGNGTYRKSSDNLIAPNRFSDPFQPLSLVSLEGNGQLQMEFENGPYSGYYPLTDAGEWQDFIPFSKNNINPIPERTELVDVTGHNRQDRLVITPEKLHYRESLGLEGISELEMVWNNDNSVEAGNTKNPFIYYGFANIYGDGLAHRVKIEHRKVTIWPSLGYGKFGIKQVCELPSFDIESESIDLHNRMALADVNGSGNADLVLIYPEYVQVFFNNGGTGFTEPVTYKFGNNLSWSDKDSIRFEDVTGNGNTCLVLSKMEPHAYNEEYSMDIAHYYYEFSLDTHQEYSKAFLLQSINNSRGNQTILSYKSSLKDYLEAQNTTHEWYTKLPFPTIVVDKIVVKDEINETERHTAFTYRNGFYDPEEHTFLGFGNIEQIDKENSSDISGNKLPATLKRVWFHIGQGINNDKTRQEFFQKDPDSPQQSFVRQDTLNNEALFTLAGQLIREEIYAYENQEYPYTIAAYCVNVQETIPPEETHKGVYRVFTDENIALNYEQCADDPKIIHHFILEADAHNLPVKECSVNYPRRIPLIEEQQKLFCTTQETEYLNQANVDNAHWIGVELAVKTYEITGLKNPVNRYYKLQEISSQLLDNGAFINQIPYSAQPTNKEVQSRLLTWDKQYYWANTEQQQQWTEGLPLPEVLLLKHSSAIAFDQIQVKELLSEKVSDTEISNAGYEWNSENQYWWKHSEVSYYDGAPGNFYVFNRSVYDWVSTTDSLYTETSIVYDTYRLFPVQRLNRLNAELTLTQTVKIDYRVLSPYLITDENDNTSEILFDVLGRVMVSATYEKNGINGDKPLTDYSIQPDALPEEILGDPRNYLQQAGHFFQYGFPVLTKDGWRPGYHLSLTRTTYRSASDKDIQRSITYTDGSERIIESRAYTGMNDNGMEQWVIKDRVHYFGKGLVNCAYLNAFAETWQYPKNCFKDPESLPPHMQYTYDAMDRQIRIDTPKGFFSELLILNAWEQQQFDQSDTILESDYYQKGSWKDNPNERDAVEKSMLFYNTPATVVTDGLNRKIITVLSNRKNSLGPDAPKIDRNKKRLVKEDVNPGDPDSMVSWQSFDISGRVLLQADARFHEYNQNSEIEVKRYNFVHKYPITTGIQYTLSSDAGVACSYGNVYGNPVSSWNALGIKLTKTYDNLQRPLTTWVQTPPEYTGEAVDQITTAILYGESAPGGKERNLFGKLWQQYDAAGLQEIPGYTFEGHPVTESFCYRKDYKSEPDWSEANRMLATKFLEKELFETTAVFDAAGRPVQQTLPDKTILTWEYDFLGNCIHSTADAQGNGTPVPIVLGSKLDENHHPVSIRYANGVMTSALYDPLTQELINLKNGRNETLLRKQNYWHDPTGLITTSENELEEPVFFRNQQVSPVSTYTYDPLYRLIRGSGREQVALGSPNNQQLRNYQETYSYDKGNNLLQLKHTGSISYTRNHQIAPDCNRVLQCMQGKVNHHIAYNPAGYMLDTFATGSASLNWNVSGNISSVVMVKRENTLDDAEYYIYSSGIRVRKIKETYDADGKLLTRDDKRYQGNYRRSSDGQSSRFSITIGGVNEHDCVLQYEVSAKALYTAVKPLLRFQHGDNLNSIGLETNNTGELISYEEYSPFGETMYKLNPKNLDSSKEYRYSAKEKDDTSGLYYYGYRYYTPGLCRWTRPDPAGTVDGLNLYVFVGNEPRGKEDLMGLTGSKGKGKAGSSKKNPKRLSRSFDDSKIAKVQLRRYEKILVKKHVDILKQIASGKKGLKRINNLSTNHKVSDLFLRIMKDRLENGNKRFIDGQRLTLFTIKLVTAFVDADTGKVSGLKRIEAEAIRTTTFNKSKEVQDTLKSASGTPQDIQLIGDFLTHFATASSANMRIGDASINSSIGPRVDPTLLRNRSPSPISRRLMVANRAIPEVHSMRNGQSSDKQFFK